MAHDKKMAKFNKYLTDFSRLTLIWRQKKSSSLSGQPDRSRSSNPIHPSTEFPHSSLWPLIQTITVVAAVPRKDPRFCGTETQWYKFLRIRTEKNARFYWFPGFQVSRRTSEHQTFGCRVMFRSSCLPQVPVDEA